MKTATAGALFAAWIFFAGLLRAQQVCPAPPPLTSYAAPNIFDTPQKELDLGNVISERLEKNFRIIHDENLAARLNGSGDRILAQLPPTQLKFHIVLIDAPNVNAFSVAAGRIYVTRKIIVYRRAESHSVRNLLFAV